MSGTSGGGKKSMNVLLQRTPNHYKEMGAKGGRSGTGHAFAHGKLEPKMAGRQGGRPRRGETLAQYRKRRKAEMLASPYI
jgi:general stress protein YciG